jgi:ABC-2 type transport system permease protein
VTALVRSELLKVRTTRGWWAYVAVIALLAGIFVAGDIGSTEDADRGTVDFQLGLVDVAGVAALLAIILGITIVTTTFLTAPHRERVLASKTVATAVVSLLFAGLAFAVVAAVAVPWLSLVDAELHFAESEILTRAAKAVLLVVLWGLLGVAIGAVVHSQVAALVGTLVWIFLAETLLVGLAGLLDVEGVAAYLPFQALDAADGTGGGDLLSYWPGVAVSLGWIAGLGALGLARTLRRDIT